MVKEKVSTGKYGVRGAASGTTEVVRLHGERGTRRATARGRGGPKKLRAQPPLGCCAL